MKEVYPLRSRSAPISLIRYPLNVHSPKPDTWMTAERSIVDEIASQWDSSVGRPPRSFGLIRSAHAPRLLRFKTATGGLMTAAVRFQSGKLWQSVIDVIAVAFLLHRSSVLEFWKPSLNNVSWSKWGTDEERSKKRAKPVFYFFFIFNQISPTFWSVQLKAIIARVDDIPREEKLDIHP